MNLNLNHNIFLSFRRIKILSKFHLLKLEIVFIGLLDLLRKISPTLLRMAFSKQRQLILALNYILMFIITYSINNSDLNIECLIMAIYI